MMPPTKPEPPGQQNHARILRPGASFIADLDHVDYLRLKDVVYRTYLSKLKPHQRTDREADRIIETYGPKVMQDLIKQAVDSKAVDTRRRIFS